jgi:transcription initiation factor TFIIF subunit beta
MRLRSDLKAHKKVPKEYNMDVVNHDVNNTFVFTEQDLPSFAAKNKERANALAQGIPAHLLRKQQRLMEQPVERGKRGAQYARRPIPSRSLACLSRAEQTVLTWRCRENENCRQDQTRSGLHSGAERRSQPIPGPPRKRRREHPEEDEDG